MKIEISLKLPYVTEEEVTKVQNVIGDSKVIAYSIDKDTFELKSDECCIKSNGSWNYHNNYDDSKDTMYFGKAEK